MGDFNAMDTFGFALQFETFLGSDAWLTVGKLLDTTGAPESELDEEDITTHASEEETEENMPTIRKVGTTSFDFVTDLSDPLHVGSSSLRQMHRDKILTRCRGINPEDGAEEFRGTCWVKKVGRDFPVKGAQKTKVTVRWTGPRAER